MKRRRYDGVPPEHVVITLTGAEIASLPDDQTRKYLMARLAAQKVRTDAMGAGLSPIHPRAIEKEIARLERQADRRYTALAAQHQEGGPQ